MTQPSMSLRVLWCAGLSLTLLSACAGRGALPAGGPTTAAGVLAKAMARPLPASVQGMSRLDAYVDGKARKADVLVRIERPDRAQFQALTPTLDLIAVLSTDGKRFVSFERGARQCYVGRACPTNLARLVPIALPAGQLVAALLGRPPLIAATRETLAWDGDRGAYRVTRVSADGRWQQQLWIAPKSFRFRASVVRREGKRVASIAYGELDALGPKGPPKVMRLQLPERKTDMSLTLRDVTLDEDVEDEAFSLPCPGGTVAVSLPCEVSRGAVR